MRSAQGREIFQSVVNRDKARRAGRLNAYPEYKARKNHVHKVVYLILVMQHYIALTITLQIFL